MDRVAVEPQTENGDGPHIPASLVSCRMREMENTPNMREHTAHKTLFIDTG